jgi:aryl-alcohol dehydrogenase-like predicted oxidoreductase
MQPHRLGNTGLIVTPLGLGLAALGRPGYITLGRDSDLGRDRSVAAMERRCHEVISAAYDAGVRYIDAARSYGMAETFLATWLEARRLTPTAMTVGSKWGYSYIGDWRLDAPVHEHKDLSLATLRRQLSESRAILGRALDLYQIHSATIESGVLEDEPLLAELARLAADGLVIGVTVTGPKQSDTIRRALDMTIDGVNPFRVVQATWNLLEPSAASALAEAHDAGWGVIVKEVLANGRLSSGSQGQLSRSVTDVARVLDWPVEDVALAAALANPWAGIVLSGAVTVQQVRNNRAVLDRSISPEYLQRLVPAAERPEQYWDTRRNLLWT